MASTPVQYTEFVHTPPVIEIRAGVVLFRNNSNCCPVRATTIAVLQKAADRAQRALKCYAAGQENVVIDD